MQAFQNAKTYSENNPILHYQLAVIYKELSIYDLAINEFLQYLEYKKDDYIALFMLGECYQSFNQFDKAIAVFKTISNKDSRNINVLYQIGISYLNLEQKNNAARYLKLALKVNPDHSLSRYNLIDIYLALNKTREAKKECDILFMLDRDLYNSSSYCTSL